jgi:hypothetical protein
VLGTVDFGVDTGILEYLGFTVEYDLSKQDVSFSPSRNDARIAGEFGVAFDTLSLLNKFGAKKVMEKTLGKTFETAVANVIKTSGYGGAFQTLVRKHAKKTADDLNLGFAKAGTGLAGKTPEWFRGTADQIADKAAKNFEGRVDEWLKQVEASLSGANFVGYSGTQVSDTIVAQALAALTEVATIHFPLWQPVYTFAVSPTGVVTDGLDPETYVNPLLLVEDLSGPPPPTPKTGAAKKKGPTVTVPAACPAGANCTGNAFITTSVSTASAAARRPPAPQVAVAHARFKIAAGRKGTLRLKLNRAALKIVRKRGVKLTLVLETTAAGSKSTVVRRKLRLR